MNTNKETKLSMILVLIQWINTNMLKLSQIPEFKAIFELFKTDTEKINSLRPAQEGSKKGITQNKTQTRENLMITLNSVSRKGNAYAVITSNLPLQDALHYTLTDLKRASDTTLGSIAKVIIDAITPIKAQLVPYGIKEEDITNLTTLLATYNTLITAPREGQIEKKDVTTQINDLFVQCDGHLAKLDALIEVIHDTDQQTYNDYWTARKVINTGKRSMALKASATEKSNGNPIANVVFEFTNTSTGEKFTKKSAVKGNLYQKNLAEGIYEVKISKNGYKPQTQIINLVSGEMYLLKVELE